MGHIISFYPWTVWILAFSASTYISALSLESNPAPEFEPFDHRNTSGIDAHERKVISVPRGSSFTAVCGNETNFSLVEAGYAKTAASKAKPASYTLPSCDKNRDLAASLSEECQQHSVSCLIDAKDSLNGPGCRWKFLVVTYECIESEEPVGLSMTGFMLDE